MLPGKVVGLDSLPISVLCLLACFRSRLAQVKHFRSDVRNYLGECRSFLTVAHLYMDGRNPMSSCGTLQCPFVLIRIYAHLFKANCDAVLLQKEQSANIGIIILSCECHFHSVSLFESLFHPLSNILSGVEARKRLIPHSTVDCIELHVEGKELCRWNAQGFVGSLERFANMQRAW